MYPKCLRCRRGLRDPASMARGLGPVCAAKSAKARAPLFECDYEIVRVDAARKIVWIRDLDKGGRSVTNDAERVVAKLGAEYPGYRLIYRDSIGNWDELKCEGTLFVGFAPALEMDPTRL